MFQISTQVKYTHIYEKAAILFHETKYMTIINIRNNFKHTYIWSLAYMYLCQLVSTLSREDQFPAIISHPNP